MAHDHASHDHGSHADDHGHPEPAETEEQRDERLRAKAVEDRWVRALKAPGAAIALVSTGLALAWLAALTARAETLVWTWLLPIVLLLGWGLALARGGEIEERGDDAAPPPAH